MTLRILRPDVDGSQDIFATSEGGRMEWTWRLRPLDRIAVAEWLLTGMSVGERRPIKE